MEQTQQFPAEEVTLPSKGLLYPEGSSLRKGIIEMKYMTAKEEDILTNQNLKITNFGKNIILVQQAYFLLLLKVAKNLQL